MDYNENKCWVEDRDLLNETEKIQMAKDLVELERPGVLEYRHGRRALAPGVVIEETPGGPMALSQQRRRKQLRRSPAQGALCAGDRRWPRHRSRKGSNRTANLRKEMAKRQGNLAREAVEVLENMESTPALDEKVAHRSRSLKR